MSFQVTNLAVGRGAKQILSDLRFDLLEGELVGLIGANGSGKTALLRVLAGLDTPQAGQLPTLSLQPPAQRRNTLAFLPQLAPPAPAYSVRDFILMASGEPLNWQARPAAIERMEEAVEADEVVDLEDVLEREDQAVDLGEWRVGRVLFRRVRLLASLRARAAHADAAPAELLVDDGRLHRSDAPGDR